MAYLARSLRGLRDEINHKWPKRDKRSDGWLGDYRHAARTSDHNPGPGGIVRALDIDKDGISPATVVAAARKHPATEYVIFNRTIWTRASGFRPRRYTGSDPHTNHIHVSIRHNSPAYNSTRPWLGTVKPPAPPKPRAHYALPQWPFGHDHSRYFKPYPNELPPKYNTVANIQRKLYSLGYNPGAIDGRYGPTTRREVLRFQKANGLKADALVGFLTYSKLRSR